MSRPELDALLVRNLADVDSAAKQLERFSVEASTALGDVAEAWAKKAKWSGDFDWSGDELTLWPKAWKTEDGWRAWFELDYAGDDEGEGDDRGNYFWLTSLCGLGIGRMGFRFHQEVAKGKPWNAVVIASPSALDGTGFAREKNRDFFMPIAIDPEVLAEAAENGALSEAFEGLTSSFNALRDAVPRFEKLMRAAEAKMKDIT